MVPLNWRQIAASGAIWRYFSRRGYLGIALMGWSSAEGETGASGWLESPFFAFAMAAPSQAQRPIPTPTAVLLPNSEISAAASLADLGSNFLERPADQ
jgi:hypothetical protein